MLHKVYLKKHAEIEVDGEKKYFAGGREHLVSPEIASKLTTQSAGGVLLEKHDTKTGKVETISPAAVGAVTSGEEPEQPRSAAKKPAASN